MNPPSCEADVASPELRRSASSSVSRAVASTRSDAFPPTHSEWEAAYPRERDAGDAPSDRMPTRGEAANASTPRRASPRRGSDASWNDQSRVCIVISRPQPSPNHRSCRDVAHSPALAPSHPRCCAGDASTSAWQRVSCLPAAASVRLMYHRCYRDLIGHAPHVAFLPTVADGECVPRDVWFCGCQKHQQQNR